MFVVNATPKGAFLSTARRLNQQASKLVDPFGPHERVLKKSKSEKKNDTSKSCDFTALRRHNS